MTGSEGLAVRFETQREHLRAVAYRILGSRDDAEDAVQTAWLRADRAGVDGVGNLAGWLTTVVARVSLDLLRARRSRAEEPLSSTHDPSGATEPEAEAVQAESVGLAMLVVLDRLTPAERVAFVLHDMFAVPFDEIAAVVDRSPVATKKLASRARNRVRGMPAISNRAELTERFAIVDALLAATRAGDLNRLVDLLAPDVVRRADRFAVPSGVPTEVRGARAVAEETRVFARRARTADVVLVDGTPGIVITRRGRLFAILAVTIDGERITGIDVFADPDRLAQTSLALGRTT